MGQRGSAFDRRELLPAVELTFNPCRVVANTVPGVDAGAARSRTSSRAPGVHVTPPSPLTRTFPVWLS